MRIGRIARSFNATLFLENDVGAGFELARPTGVEPVASRLEVSRSIQLS